MQILWCKVMVPMYLPFTVHCFYRPYHLTFLGYGSWFQCFAFFYESRFSNVQAFPNFNSGGWWSMIQSSSPVDAHLAVNCVLLTIFIYLCSVCFLENFLQISLKAFLCLRLSLIRLQFLFLGHLLETIFRFRAPCYKPNATDF